MNVLSKRTQIMLLALLLVFLTVFTAGCSEKAPANTEPTYSDFGDMEEIPPETTLPPVQIEMPDYELTYSGEFQDVILVEKQENELVFTVKLSKTEAHIFTLRYNTDEGELVTVLEDADGNRIPVAFQMAQIPENLNKEDELLFCSAQEAVNEIVASLVLK